VLASFALMVPAIIAAEKKDKMRPIFLAAIGLTAIVQLGLYLFSQSLWLLGFWLLLFFVAFNILEASQPSLVSRMAPASARGAALGIYNTMQAIGLFAGGAGGGLLAKHYGAPAVFTAGCVVTLAWLIIASSMKHMPRRAQREAAPA
jgi:predicted MFS family arabinose efflux permease